MLVLRLKKDSKQCSGSKGFALIETLVSLVIVTLSILGVMAFLAGTQKNNNSQRAFIAAQNSGNNFMSSVGSHVTPLNIDLYTNASIDSEFEYEHCIDTACDSQAYAKKDINFFIERLYFSLNKPRFEVFINSGYLKVNLYWQDIISVSLQEECRNESAKGESCMSFFQVLSL